MKSRLGLFVDGDLADRCVNKKSQSRRLELNQVAPLNPVGPFVPTIDVGVEDRRNWIEEILRLPEQIRIAVDGLSESQLDTKYRNWTIRQIVHHVADSHVNCYVRFKWALTEDTPTIKAYDEGLWSTLTESQTGDVTPSLQLLDGLHARWHQLLCTMSDSDFSRSFHHPESGDTVSLVAALESYVWHGKHHTGQILWIREMRGY